MDVLATDTFGRPVKLIHKKIYKILTSPCEGMAHVYAHDPKMVVIHRIKDNGLWSVSVDELYDTEVEGSKLESVYFVRFKDDEIDTAIELFLALIKFQRKDFLQSMRKKFGKSIILAALPRTIPTDCHDVQKYLYEEFRASVKRSLRRRRSGRTARRRSA